MQASGWADSLRAVLTDRGWSAYRLAAAIGADRSLVSKWLRGECSPSPRYRALVADALDAPELAQGTATADGWV